VAQEHKGRYSLICSRGEISGELTGRLIHLTETRDKLPVVGDWVAARLVDGNQRAVIHTVLPRKSLLSRKAVMAGGPKYGPGRTEQQIMAANINTVFLVSGLDEEFNLRRIERYLSVAWDSGAAPVVLLNKADLCDDVESYLEQVEGVAIAVPIHALSAADNKGLMVLEDYLQPGRTAIFLGSSGVGKSTIINCLLGETRQKTFEVSDFKSRGRHTTTAREMIFLPSGGIVIDTPGMRELQLWMDDEDLSSAFDDIAALAEKCRFRDCRHQGEPGCAVVRAVDEGQLDRGRLQNYFKLQKELAHLERRRNIRAQQLERDKWKKITKQMRGFDKGRR
jgi:ribosome biogenesis GTPase